MIRYADMLKKLGKGQPHNTARRPDAGPKPLQAPRSVPVSAPIPAMEFDAGMTLDDRPAVTVAQTPAVDFPKALAPDKDDIGDVAMGKALTQGRMTPLETMMETDDEPVAVPVNDDEIDALFSEAPSAGAATAAKTMVSPVASLSSQGLAADEPAMDSDSEIDALFADAPGAGEPAEETSKTLVETPSPSVAELGEQEDKEASTVTAPSEAEIDALFSETSASTTTQEPAPLDVANVASPEDAQRQASEAEIDALFSDTPDPAPAPVKDAKPENSKASRLADHAATTEKGIESLFADTPEPKASASSEEADPEPLEDAGDSGAPLKKKGL